eukprot:scaffold47897_cov17-Tisochrysis_lutea.AAC.1
MQKKGNFRPQINPSGIYKPGFGAHRLWRVQGFLVSNGAEGCELRGSQTLLLLFLLGHLALEVGRNQGELPALVNLHPVIGTTGQESGKYRTPPLFSAAAATVPRFAAPAAAVAAAANDVHQMLACRNLLHELQVVERVGGWDEEVEQGKGRGGHWGNRVQFFRLARQHEAMAGAAVGRRSAYMKGMARSSVTIIVENEDCAKRSAGGISGLCAIDGPYLSKKLDPLVAHFDTCGQGIGVGWWAHGRRRGGEEDMYQGLLRKMAIRGFQSATKMRYMRKKRSL